MKILSRNVRGMNNPCKICRVSQIFSVASPDWVGVQESKLRKVSDPIIGKLYGNQNVGFAYTPAIDSFGDITCWNSASFTKSSRFCYARFIAFKSSWLARDGNESLICIYAPNDYADRVNFFDSIKSFVHNWKCRDSIIFGNFNSILHGDERWGINGFGSALKELANFIDSLDLHDLPL